MHGWQIQHGSKENLCTLNWEQELSHKLVGYAEPQKGFFPMLEKMFFPPYVSQGHWAYITSFANSGFYYLIRKGDYSGTWASCSILGKYKFPFGCWYKMHCDNAVQCNAVSLWKWWTMDHCQPQLLFCNIKYPYYQLSKQICFKRPSHTSVDQQ